MATAAIFLSSVVTFLIPFFIVVALISAKSKQNKNNQHRRIDFSLPQAGSFGRHSQRQTAKPYNPTNNTADYPTACQASYNPQRARDQLDTLLKAGHLTRQEYAARLEQLKKYTHC